MSPQVSLKPITPENFNDVLKLAVREDQKTFVATNVYSIAQASLFPTWEPLGVYDGEKMVGFVMTGQDEDNGGEWWLIRLMIDKTHQGKGYGKAATLAALAHLRQKPGCDEVFLSFEPENTLAEAMYSRLGFKDTGRVEWGETVYSLKLTD